MDRLPSPTPLIVLGCNATTAWLILNRAERRNAINREMWAAIPACMARLAAEKGIRVIVIRGAGDEAFAAGADIGEFAGSRGNAAQAAEYEELTARAFAALRTGLMPSVAMISGFCFGGGLALALACDVRLAAPTAVFSLPPARLGLAYPLDGLIDLIAAVGPAAAKEMIFTARRYAAAEALAIGLVNRIAANLDEETERLCAEIAAGAPLTIRASKRAIDHLTGRAGSVSRAEAAALARACFDSNDYAEGRRAFAEKRAPSFTGS
jgi:enoyl-CoA hydratase/carnithine racemase